jgi:hypothetical protein
VGREGGRQVAVRPEDYDGKYDARTLWMKQIWPPQERILSIAFPKTDWSDYKYSGRATAVHPNQTKFDFPIPERKPKEERVIGKHVYVIYNREESLTDDDIAEAIDMNPGPHRIRFQDEMYRGDIDSILDQLEEENVMVQVEDE